jgi:hypothetical protein
MSGLASVYKNMMPDHVHFLKAFWPSAAGHNSLAGSEMASAAPSHQGAMAPKAQPNRGRPMRVPTSPRALWRLRQFCRSNLIFSVKLLRAKKACDLMLLKKRG